MSREWASTASSRERSVAASAREGKTLQPVSYNERSACEEGAVYSVGGREIRAIRSFVFTNLLSRRPLEREKEHLSLHVNKGAYIPEDKSYSIFIFLEFSRNKSFL